jgi:FkbM family methyltransferase
MNSTLLQRWLLRVRPAELADLLKRVMRIKREVVVTPTGMRLWLDPVTHFGQHVVSPQGYEMQMSSLIKGLIRKGDMFVDVGANEGYYSVLASLASEGGRVFALEPQSRLIPVIKENLRLNDCRNASVSHVALSDRTGTATLHLQASTNTGSSGLFNPRSRGLGREQVSTMTLDDYFAEHRIDRVRMMKVDCEGAEKLVMDGGRETLRSRVCEILAWEYHPGIVSEEEIAAMDGFLKDCGYLLLNLSGQTLYCLPGLEEEVRVAARHASREQAD